MPTNQCKNQVAPDFLGFDFELVKKLQNSDEPKIEVISAAGSDRLLSTTVGRNISAYQFAARCQEGGMRAGNN